MRFDPYVTYVWAIRESRNKVKFDGMKMLHDHIYNRVAYMIKLLGREKLLDGKHWKGQQQVTSVFNCHLPIQQHKMPKVVRWQRPPSGRYKLNSDGAKKGNTVLEGGGFIIRNDQGVCLFAAGCFFGPINSLEAEVKALAAGMEFALGGAWLILTWKSILSMSNYCLAREKDTGESYQTWRE